jgi:hypothetical protein
LVASESQAPIFGERAFLSIPATNRRVPHIRDFLCSFVGSLNCMRLSLNRAAHAVLS